jgi:Domain of unknown function (DUF4404)
MSDPKLRALLTQLHAHLTQAPSLDSDARKRLTAALHDIEQALSRSGKTSAPTKSRLEALAVQFEADHPAVAGVVRQLIDALGSAGI